MSKRYWTWIRIGGAVERSRVDALLRVIRRAQVGLDWFGLFDPEDPEHLLESLKDGWLWLCDSTSRDGDLPGMEEVCQGLGLSYRKHIEGCCGDGAVLILETPWINIGGRLGGGGGGAYDGPGGCPGANSILGGPGLSGADGVAGTCPTAASGGDGGQGGGFFNGKGGTGAIGNGNDGESGKQTGIKGGA